MDGFELEGDIGIDEGAVVGFGEGVGFTDSVKSERLNIRREVRCFGWFSFFKTFYYSVY